MANIYPQIFNGPPKEKRVFDSLKKMKDDELTIFHNRTYQYRNSDGELRYGETADFLILHKKKGLIFLEAKSGIIKYNRDDEVWSQNGRVMEKNGKSYDPFTQGERHLYSFLKLIKATKIDIPVTKINAALFFDTPKPNIPLKDFRAGLRSEQMMWREDFLNFHNSIYKLYSLQETKSFINDNNFKKLTTYLIGRTFNDPLAKFLKGTEENQEIIFSEEQQHIMDTMFYSQNKNIAVKGLAGTGKTNLIVQKALQEIKKNKKVLITSKNKPICKFINLIKDKKIKEYLSDNKETSKLDIKNFDAMVRDVHVKEKEEDYKRLGDFDNSREYFDTYVPNQCYNFFQKYPKYKYDLILIDEAQDLHENCYEGIMEAKKEEGQIVFFYDPLQNLKTEKSLASYVDNDNQIYKYPLSKNFRSSDEIVDLIKKLLNKFFPEIDLSYKDSTHTTGKETEYIECKDWNDQILKVCESAKRLVNKEKIEEKNIAILYAGSVAINPEDREKINFTKTLEETFSSVSADYYNLPYLGIYKDRDYSKYISKDSINRFKGLEKTAIILFNIEKLDKDAAQSLYTGLSRARAHLIIVSKKDILDKIKLFK